MEHLTLAIKARLPMIHVTTSDILNVKKILDAIAGEDVKAVLLPASIADESKFSLPKGDVFYCSNNCSSLQLIYRFMSDKEKTLIFVNTEKSVLHFDGGELVPPKALVLKEISEFSDEADTLAPAFAGTTLKDMREIAQLTATRDEGLSTRGIAQTRRSYNTLKGIQPVDTNATFYVCPNHLQDWLDENAQFFIKDISPALTPKGILAGGPPGTGKTMAAKAIANRFGVPLYRLDIGAVMGKYVGDSEAGLTAALNQLDQVSPSVCLIDEVEKIFQSQGDSGVTSRLLSQLLWWMNERKSKTFVVMTTNDVGKIPPELYREGRIDATMEFNGVDDMSEAVDFTLACMKSVAKTIPMEVVDSDYEDTIRSRVEVMFAENSHVAQVKLQGLAQYLVKQAVKESYSDL